MSQERRKYIQGRGDLRYPLTIISLDLASGSDVHKFQPVFTYSFLGTAVESQDDGEDKEVPRRFVESFDSAVEGIECQWHIHAGDIITDPSSDLFSVIEPCSHEVQFAGLCANCGKDLTQGDYLGHADVSRATVAMSHDTLGLTVSYGEAARLERETTRRLIRTSKLSLIVDLDQCVIQTTVDPTVGEWLRDANNPNHAALQDVQQFRIAEEGPLAPVYYVKPRPGLTQFLTSMSRKYEMHVYTMGTKPYARKVASVIDPEGIFFGSRILSRDENGSNTQKSVQRLFPVDTNMVVIIDDRGDVWQWSPNLIKVNPFEFFVGIGDINSSFLPKLHDKPLVAGEVRRSDMVSAAVSNEAEQAASLVSNVVVDDPETLAAQADAQTATLEAQVEERPLAKQQNALHEEDDSIAGAGLLKCNDNELAHLEKALKQLHERFYSTYNAKMGEVARERNLAMLKAKPSQRARNTAADVKSILPDMKRAVLQDVIILFSGLIRSDRDPRAEWQGQLAIQFGARVLDSRSHELPTHIIVGMDITPTNLTEKAKLSKTYPWIKLVYLPWLTDSVAQFRKLEEQAYQVDKTAVHVPLPAKAQAFAVDDGPPSDTESITTDNGVTDRLINEAAKTMDWASMRQEVEDFIGEDASDDNATTTTTTTNSDDSDSSAASATTSQRLHRRSHKRERPTSATDAATTNGQMDDLLRSPLSKRRKMAKLRKSGLAHSVRAASSGTDSRDSSVPARHHARRRELVEEDHLEAGEDADRDEDGTSVSSESGSDMDDFANQLALQLEEA